MKTNVCLYSPPKLVAVPPPLEDSDYSEEVEIPASSFLFRRTENWEFAPPVGSKFIVSLHDAEWIRGKVVDVSFWHDPKGLEMTVKIDVDEHDWDDTDLDECNSISEHLIKNGWTKRWGPPAYARSL